MSDLRIHLSFDLDHDRDLHDRLVAQAHPVPFAVASRSEAGAMDDEWSERVRHRIAHADEVVVICGEHTDECSRVSAELEIAQELHKPYVLLWGRRDSMCKKPKGARPDDGMYLWTPAVLANQLVYSLRASRERVVPESMKRQPQPPRISPAL